jgi:hypothetical protein
MTKWLVITVMACTLTICGSPAYAKDYSSSKSSYTSKTSAVKKKPSRSYSFSNSKPFYIVLPQANGADEVECVKQGGGVYKCEED